MRPTFPGIDTNANPNPHLLAQAPKPTTGPHKLRECLPLILILRNRLKYALNRQEVIKILMQVPIAPSRRRSTVPGTAGTVPAWPGVSAALRFRRRMRLRAGVGLPSPTCSRTAGRIAGPPGGPNAPPRSAPSPQRLIKVDGKTRSDGTYPCGFMDVVQIPKTDEHFRLLYDTKASGFPAGVGARWHGS